MRMEDGDAREGMKGAREGTVLAGCLAALGKYPQRQKEGLFGISLPSLPVLFA